MKGQIKLPLDEDRYFVVYGGRYRERPVHLVGVKMAREIDAPCTIDIPTRDFSTPPADVMDKGLREAVRLITRGGELYVGCMGGVGRTGLFLAILAKAFGVHNPVTYVRKNYDHHAVETDDQMDYVLDYKIPLRVKWEIFKSRFRYRGWAGKITGYTDEVSETA